MTDAQEITVETGVAQLSDTGFADSPLVVSGVAMGEDEITHHEDGDKIWPAEQLQAAVETLEGVQLTKNHNHDKVEGVIGRVTRATYKEGVGIVFQAEVHDKEVAQKIENGLLEVSVHAIHQAGGFDEDGRMIVENVHFKDLSVVPRGAAASNTVKPGSIERVALSANDIEDLVAQEFDTYRDILSETASQFDVELQEGSDLDDIYDDWQEAVNMTAAQLRSWSENPCSREASIRPKLVLRRNLRLLEKPRDEWTAKDFDDAQRATSFIARMSAQRPDNPRDGPSGCPSKWAISLLNWGYNPFSSVPDVPEEMESVEEVSYGENPVAELNENMSAIHMPEYEGTTEDSWDSPDMEDFPSEYFDESGEPKFDLIDNHFIYSETQFPPNNYTDLKFPVVEPSGELNLNALRSAKSYAPQADIPVDEQEEIQNVVNELAAEAFGKEWGDESVDVENAESDDVETQSDSEGADADTNKSDSKMTEEETETEDVDVEALQARVEELEDKNERLRDEVESVRAEYAEALSGDTAFSADELAEKFTVDELREKYDESEAELAESEPAPQTGGMEETEASAEEDEVDDEKVEALEAKLAKYEKRGWDGAAGVVESELAELTDE